MDSVLDMMLKRAMLAPLASFHLPAPEPVLVLELELGNKSRPEVLMFTPRSLAHWPPLLLVGQLPAGLKAALVVALQGQPLSRGVL